MKRQTQKLLYHLLPVAFWLLAIGGIVLWHLFYLQSPISNFQSSISNYAPALLVLISALIIRHIPRHRTAEEPAFQAAVLLGVAAYFLPSVLVMLLPMWVYLIYRHLYSWRVFFASLIGIALVAIWVMVLSQFSILNSQFSIAHNVCAWFPTGTCLLAYIASTIVRQTLRER